MSVYAFKSRIQKSVIPEQLCTGKRYTREIVTDGDDFGPFRGLLIAVPLGLLVWIGLIWLLS